MSLIFLYQSYAELLFQEVITSRLTFGVPGVPTTSIASTNFFLFGDSESSVGVVGVVVTFRGSGVAVGVVTCGRTCRKDTNHSFEADIITNKIRHHQ